MLSRSSRSQLSRAGSFLILLSVLLLASTGFIYTASVAEADAPAKIEGVRHEGQEQAVAGVPDPSGAWTTGNVTSYQEGDRVNFRVNLTANYDGLSGTMQIRYSKEVPGACLFFIPTLTLGTHISVPDNPGSLAVVAVSGETMSVSLGSLVDEGNEHVQAVNIVWSSGVTPENTGGEAWLYYYLELDRSVNGCTGSSQHSRLAAPADPAAGDYKQSGMKNVPVPATAVVRVPDVTVTKKIDRDGNGTFEALAEAGEYSFTLSGPGGTWTLPTNSSGQVIFENVEPAGQYTVTETQLDFDPKTFTFDHIEGSVVPLEAGCTQGTGATAIVTVVAASTTDIPNPACTFFNEWTPPPPPATLTVIKHVINDNGGTAVAGNWTMDVTATNPSNDLFAGSESPGTTLTIEAGAYSVDELPGPSGYAKSLSAGCSGVAVPSGSYTCTITNDDVAPSLTLIKQVVNDNGGTSAESAWTLSASGPTPLSGPGPSVSSGAGFGAGTYTLSESGPFGYTAGTWVCAGGTQNGNQITLGLSQSATCTIINDDDAPSLTLIKAVTNDNGGTAQPSAWTLSAAGPTGFSGAGPSVPSPAGFDAGTYTLSESGPAGYTASAWSCVGGTQNGNQIAVGLGQNVTCTITNNDNPPGLTLVKQVINDNGGTALPSAWTLSAAGPTSFSGPGPSVSNGAGFVAGTYTLSESGPAGYAASAWSCVGGSQVGSQITLGVGESATCTITNNDIAPSLTLVKQVVNDDGGTALPSAWTLSAAGPTGFSGAGPSVSSGGSFVAGTYTLSESGPAGYAASAWSCVGGSQNGSQITLGLGDSATCTITNDDISPDLTLVKQVVNDNGGTALPSAWTLSAAGPTGFSGAGPSVPSPAGFNAGTYTLSESGPAGYAASAWSCVGGSQNGSQITLGLGESAVCTIVNDDIAPALTLIKVVSLDSGGTALPSAWTLTAAGPTGFSGPGPSVSNGASFDAGTYTLSESGPAGYTAGTWVCIGGEQSGDQITLGLGDSAVCTIVNSDDPPALTLVKVVINDAGGTAVPADWTLTAAGPTGFSGAGPSVSNGAGFMTGTYTLSESGPAGYLASAWVCVGGTQVGNQITLGLGQSAICAITNNDDEPSITIRKVALPLETGDATLFPFSGDLGAFSLANGGQSVHTGLDAGIYAITETLPASAQPRGEWLFDRVECTGGSYVAGVRSVAVNLALGQDVICTFFNFEQQTAGPNGSITIVKQTSPAGGTGFNFTTSGNLSGPFALNDDGSKSFIELEPGVYTITEAIPSGDWAFLSVTCNAASYSKVGRTVTINLAEGENVLCTYYNGSLPYTGAPWFLMPMLLAGLMALAMGLALWVWSWMREASVRI